MNENEQRAALEAVRKDASDPTLAVGDFVFHRGVYALVTEINRLAPGAHAASPIRNDWVAVQIVTDMGGARWHGVKPEPQDCDPDCKSPCCEGAHLTADLAIAQSGYTPCACRDCMDITMSSDTSKPELCSKCAGAGCVKYPPSEEEWRTYPAACLFECQRDDAYECEESVTPVNLHKHSCRARCGRTANVLTSDGMCGYFLCVTCACTGITAQHLKRYEGTLIPIAQAICAEGCKG
jgi:hypothetical protein